MKSWMAGLVMMSAVTVVHAATQIGGDDFNDNSFDSAWSLYFTDPGVAFTETNQRLEYTSDGGEKYVGWYWTDNTLSATQDWSIVIDSAYLLDPATLDSSQRLDLQFRVQTATDDFGLKFQIDQNGFGLLTQESDVVSDEVVFEAFQSITTSQLTMRVSFDADTETMTTAYNAGAGYITLTNRNISGWGLSGSSTFTPYIGSDNVNVPVSAGEAYFDNFKIFTLIGSDDFNDNSFDPAWSLYYSDPGVAFTETNQRLEYTSGGGEQYVGWYWTGNTLSAAEDWSIVIDCGCLLAPGALDSSQRMDLQLRVQTDSDDFGLKFQIDQGGLGLLTQESDVITDEVVFEDFQSVAASHLTMRVSFDAATETMTTAYDAGAGYVTLTNRDISGWGLSGSTTFTPYIGSDNVNVPVAAGEIYFDNFKIFSDGLTTSNFSGADDFNDNAVDGALWTLSAPGLGLLSEINGRLEYAGNTDEAGASWIANIGSYTHDWSAVIDTHNTEDGCIAGMYVSFGPSNSWLNIENQRSADIIPQHVVLNGFSATGDDLDAVYAQSAPITNDTVRLALAFDAATKTIHGAFDLGEGFIPVTNFNVSASGMGDSDTFTLGFYAGTESPVTVAPGALYFDNFEAYPDAGYLGSDSDADGLTFKDEWIAGTDPNNAASVFAVTNAAPTPSGYVLHWSAVPGRLYTVQWADSLTSGLSPIATGIAYPQNSYTDTVHAAESGGFYNLKVERQ